MNIDAMKYLRYHPNFISEKAFDKAFQLEDNAEPTSGGNGPVTGKWVRGFQNI